MDIILNNEVKELIRNKYFSFQKNFSNDFSDDSYMSALDKVVYFSSVLQVFQEGYIKGDIEYSYVKHGLESFVEQLINLGVLLEYQQQKNIDFTNKVMQHGDSDSYLQQEEIVDLVNTVQQKRIASLINSKVNIEKLINKTAKRYTDRFGEFEDLKTTQTILEKEFSETKEYLNFLQAISNIKFRKTNNLSPLIEAVSSMAYESIQLSAVIKRAERFLERNPKIKKDYTPIYIIMDGVNSTDYMKKENYFENLKVKTEELNSALVKHKSIDLICNFMTYKQDEVHGVVNGNINEVKNLLESVYAPYQFRLAYSDKEITNIKQTTYGIPFELYGPACTEARRKLENKSNDLIFINSTKNNVKSSDAENREF